MDFTPLPLDEIDFTKFGKPNLNFDRRLEDV